MLTYLISYLAASLSIKLPSVFFYASTRMILGSLTSLLITIVLGPKVILFLYNMKTGQSIRVEDCPVLATLHESKKQTPSMGGVLILFSVLISLILWMDFSSVFTVILLFSTLYLAAIGGYDDFLKMKYKNSKGLKSSKKFFLQLILCVILSSYLYFPNVGANFSKTTKIDSPIAKIEGKPKKGLSISNYQRIYYMPFVKKPLFILPTGFIILAVLFTTFVITGTSNAVNLSDGLDGLAAGLVMMSSLVLAIFAFLSNHAEFANYLNIIYIEGSSEIAVFLSSIFGASLGFLWYNSYPAQVFMGDVGSIPLGGLLGICAVLLRREFLLALVGGIFVLEALSVIMQVASFKLRKGKRIFLCAPIHHHFEYRGIKETKVVIRFWIVGLILALIGLASLKFQ